MEVFIVVLALFLKDRSLHLILDPPRNRYLFARFEHLNRILVRRGETTETAFGFGPVGDFMDK